MPHSMSAVDFCHALGVPALGLLAKVKTSRLSWRVSVVE